MAFNPWNAFNALSKHTEGMIKSQSSGLNCARFPHMTKQPDCNIIVENVAKGIKYPETFIKLHPIGPKSSLKAFFAWLG